MGGSLLVTWGLATAAGQPDGAAAGPGDGLVTLLIGESTAQQSVPVATAAAVAAEICGGDPAAVVGLGQLVDAEGAGRTVCANVAIVQNSGPPVPATPAEATVESQAPAVPGGEQEEAEPDGGDEAPTPPVPGEGESDIPFNAGE